MSDISKLGFSELISELHISLYELGSLYQFIDNKEDDDKVYARLHPYVMKLENEIQIRYKNAFDRGQEYERNKKK